jgi:polysaccharide deacetylase 2 family uncharacterized protein YibQ
MTRKRDGRRAFWALLALFLAAGWWFLREPASVPTPLPTPPPAEPLGRLAVVLDDWGYQREPIRRLPALAGPITVAVIPRLAHSREAALAAAAAGFEVILHCPMAAKGGGHPEPGLLEPGMDALAVRASLERDFIDVPGAVGLNNHEGSLATEDRALMDAVAAVLKDRGAYFLDSLTSPKSQVRPAAKAAGIPFAARRVFLDNVDEPGAIRAQLAQAQKLSARPGGCIVIGHPRRHSLDVLEAELPRLKAEGYALVKVSDLLERP